MGGMHRIHGTVAIIVVQGMLGGCLSPPGQRKPELKAAKTTAADQPDVKRAAPPERREPPVAAPTPSEQPPPPEPGPATIGDLVADVALIHRGELICSDGMQCNGTASWSNCDQGSPKVAANDEVRVVTAAGVEKLSLVIRSHSVRVAPMSIELGLALRKGRPSATARLEARRLDTNVSAAEAKTVRKWIEKSFPDSLGPTALTPIGAVTGTFGNGVDRILVFAPKRRLTRSGGSHESDIEELGHDGKPLDHDVAVLLADGEPRGILPFETVTGLELAYAVDLDGDGTQELVWIMQGPSVTIFTFLAISYFTGSEFAVREVAGCTYAGCDDFLPVEQCGHSQLKWKKGQKR